MTSFKRILVTYGSKRGGTQQIAAEIAGTLRAAGAAVDLMPADGVTDVTPYHAVVVGGSVYVLRWHRHARRFIRRHIVELRRREVWMFSSGPLHESTSIHDIPPVSGVDRLMAEVGARGHATFGGRLESTAEGWPAAAMAKKHAGDWRDWQQVRNWARQIVTALDKPAPVKAPFEARAFGSVLGMLCLLVGAMAIVGGIALVARPDGSALHVPLDALEGSPFTTFLIPGLLLLFVIGFGNMIAGTLVFRHTAHADIAAFGAGIALFGWTTIQLAITGSVNGLLQTGCFLTGIMIVYLSMRLYAHQGLTSSRS